MSGINLSYIISTKNRLPFLKILLGTDGSAEYLKELYTAGKIHQYVSEPDKNQAHGWNKALLMAKGTIIKKLIDDDVFSYQAIRICKQYMLQNPQVGVVISNDLGGTLSNYKNVHIGTRKEQFEKWRDGSVPSFSFGDVYMLIRRTALAYIGLYNTSYVMMDWEYSLRMSYLKAKIVYYTGYNAMSVAHPQTVSSLKDAKLVEEQGKRGSIFYEYKGDKADIGYWSKLKIMGGTLVKSGKSQP